MFTPENTPKTVPYDADGRVAIRFPGTALPVSALIHGLGSLPDNAEVKTIRLEYEHVEDSPIGPDRIAVIVEYHTASRSDNTITGPTPRGFGDFTPNVPGIRANLTGKDAEGERDD